MVCIIGIRLIFIKDIFVLGIYIVVFLLVFVE